MIESRLYDDTADEAYQKVMSNLGIDLETPFAQFNLYTNAETFTGNRAELCKLLINFLDITISETLSVVIIAVCIL